MQSVTYLERRGQLETYFDRTAVEAWTRLTSDAPVGRIRATVRAGRAEMRKRLLSWLPADMRGRRVLDAGCGTGAFAVEAARRGAAVLAVDLSPTLVQLARDRSPAFIGPGRVDFMVHDLSDPDLGRFDHVVAMDSLIHYRVQDTVRVIDQLAKRTERSIVFTFAPRTPALAAMHAVGRLFPRGNRAPAVTPVSETRIQRLLGETLGHESWRVAMTRRVQSGFYMSQAVGLLRG